MDLPEDYKPCSECNYDHSYEPEEAVQAHKLIELEKSCNWCEVCGEDMGDSDCCENCNENPFH